MSINNIYVVKEHNGQWYGWDEMAERSMLDKPNRVVRFSQSRYIAKSRKGLLIMMDKSSMLSPEYGVTSSYLSDGTKIEFRE